MGEMSQDLQWIPETIDSTKLYTYYVFPIAPGLLLSYPSMFYILVPHLDYYFYYLYHY